jgi:hypothetical protein
MESQAPFAQLAWALPTILLALAGQELASLLAMVLFGAHLLELLLAAAVLLSPPLRAPASSILAWAPLVMILGFPVTAKVLKLRWVELKVKNK